MLPDELLLTLTEQWPCRETQLKQLNSLLSVSWRRETEVSDSLTEQACTPESFDDRSSWSACNWKELHCKVISESE